MGRRSEDHKKVHCIKYFESSDKIIGEYHLNEKGKLKKPLKLLSARKKYERTHPDPRKKYYNDLKINSKTSSLQIHNNQNDLELQADLLLFNWNNISPEDYIPKNQYEFFNSTPNDLF